MRKSDAEHVILDFATCEAVCLHCGDRYKINLPVPLAVFTAMGKAFSKAHKNCQPRETVKPSTARGGYADDLKCLSLVSDRPLTDAELDYADSLEP